MHRAFSLIELVIVVVIIGVIAAIAVPRATNASRNAAAAAMAAHLQRMASAFELYHAEHGAWPANQGTGVFPPEMAGYLSSSDFGPTPAGATYDWQNWMNGARPIGGCIIGIGGNAANPITDWKMIRQVDRLIDDGDLSTGAFVRHSTTNATLGAGNCAGLRLVVE